jgi:sugar/nucleoside kinase (ribokinase family)
VAEAEWVHCSGYALADDDSGDALAACLGRRAEAARLSVAGGSFPPEPAAVARLRARLVAARPDLLIAGRDEVASLLGEQGREPGAAAAQLLALAPVVVVTDGARGSAAAMASGEGLVVPAPESEQPVVDSTGSGDAYAAALIAELAARAAGRWPPTSAVLRQAMVSASLHGARVARVIGAQGRVEGEA